MKGMKKMKKIGTMDFKKCSKLGAEITIKNVPLYEGEKLSFRDCLIIEEYLKETDSCENEIIFEEIHMLYEGISNIDIINKYLPEQDMVNLKAAVFEGGNKSKLLENALKHHLDKLNQLNTKDEDLTIKKASQPLNKSKQSRIINIKKTEQKIEEFEQTIKAYKERDYEKTKGELIKKPIKKSLEGYEINKEELIKIILEVQHELNTAQNSEEITIRKKQLQKLIDSVKKHYGLNES